MNYGSFTMVVIKKLKLKATENVEDIDVTRKDDVVSPYKIGNFFKFFIRLMQSKIELQHLPSSWLSRRKLSFLYFCTVKSYN